MCTIHYVYHKNWWSSNRSSCNFNLAMQMYSLFEYSSSYSDTTGSLWFYSLHEKPCFLSPAISWKAKKDQVNIIFPSTFWLKKRLYSHHWKVQNKNFSLTSKYHLSISFLTQKKTVFPTTEKFKTRTFQ